MARVIYGSIVTSIHGSLGGHTFQGNKFGNTVKNKSMPSGAMSPWQLSNQQLLSSITKLWSTLDGTQQTNWNNFASTYPVYPNGSSTALSGFQVFCKFNIFQGTIGRAPMTGVTFGLVRTTDFAPIIKVDTIDVLFIYFTATEAIAGNVYSLSLSQGLPSLSAPSQFKKRVVGEGNGSLSFAEVGLSYIKYYGKLPIVGSYVKLEILEFAASIPYLPAPKTYYLQVQSV